MCPQLKGCCKDAAKKGRQIATSSAIALAWLSILMKQSWLFLSIFVSEMEMEKSWTNNSAQKNELRKHVWGKCLCVYMTHSLTLSHSLSLSLSLYLSFSLSVSLILTQKHARTHTLSLCIFMARSHLHLATNPDHTSRQISSSQWSSNLFQQQTWIFLAKQTNQCACSRFFRSWHLKNQTR